MQKIYICERCGTRYNLKDAYFLRKNSQGEVNKYYSALSYKYCQDCLPIYEKDAEQPGSQL